VRTAPVDPVSLRADVTWVDEHVDENTVCIIGSACNYGYGTIDPIEELAEVALAHGTGCTSTAASAAGCSPSARSSATTSPSSTSGFGG